VALDGPAAGARVVGQAPRVRVDDEHPVRQAALGLLGDGREAGEVRAGRIDEDRVEVPQRGRGVVEEREAGGRALGAQRGALVQGAVEGDDPREQLGVAAQRATRRRRRRRRGG
jgi:hypothetical protein